MSGVPRLRVGWHALLRAGTCDCVAIFKPVKLVCNSLLSSGGHGGRSGRMHSQHDGFSSARQLSTLPGDAAQVGPPKIDKLLVANRGEIACRVLTTARRLGIPTVAVYSEADRGAAHVEMADEAFCVGQPPAVDSYLRSGKILEVARRAGATAIHPGYGFLSENAGFARLCQDHGITFVGPPASAIAAMGDKSQAKAAMDAAGVPVVPGYHGEDQSEDRLRAEAAKTGYPLLVKATLGGGGKGMKLANAEGEFQDALSSAKREAAAAFGDDRVLLERFIPRPRHIEVQVMADSHGGALYLFERDCSVQRRHQKVIEEAPAPGISAEFRKSIGEAAVAAARAVGYTNAGTVEFIVDTDTGEYFFMEMNTRLQVEHPVTEMVTRLDLVELQLRVAAGEKLPLSQEQLRLHGHAFEARLYAEIPERGFLPATGVVRRWRPPADSCAFTLDRPVRVDAGVRAGDAVGVFYDPMIAKVVAAGVDRATALSTLSRALCALQVSGVPTNQAFLKRLAAHPAFAAAELDTSFIKKHEAELMAVAPPAASVVALAALAQHLLKVAAAQELGQIQTGPWAILDSARFGLPPMTKNCIMVHQISQAPASLSLTFARGGAVHVKGEIGELGMDELVTNLQLEGDRISAEIGGRTLRGNVCFYQHLNEEVLTLWVEGECEEFRTVIPQRWTRTGAAAAVVGTVLTPMPGKVVKVFVEDGQEVEEGAALLVLEAMKMEHTVRAPCQGTVTQLACVHGAQIDDGATLAVVVPPEAAASFG